MRTRILPAFLLMTGVALVFSPLLSRSPHSTDERLLTRLERIDTPEAITREFTHPHYREPLPLAALFLRAQQLVAPDGTITPFVLAGLALHSLCVLLLFGLLRTRGLGPWPSGIFAAAYALHPVQVQSVARPSDQGELLAVLFVFLGLMLHQRGVRGLDFSLLGCLVLGAAASPVALLLPVLLVLVAKRPGAEFNARIPLFVASGLIGLFLFSRTTHDFGFLDWPWGPLDHLQHLGAALLLSFQDLVAPYHLAPFHVLPSPVPAWVPPVVFAFAVGCAWLGSRGKSLGTGAWWLSATLLFAAARGLFRFEYRSDAWLALALVGLVWVVMERFGRSGRFPRVVGLIILVFWGIFAHGQARTWNDERTLLDHTLELRPDNWQAHVARAELAMDEGDATGCRQHAFAALRARPQTTAAIFQLAHALGVEGNEDAFRRLSTYALKSRTDGPEVEWKLAYVLLESDLREEALDLLERVADHREAHPGLALSRARLGDTAAAQAQLTATLAAPPSSYEARLALAWLLATAPEAELRDPDAALEIVNSVGPTFARDQALDVEAAALAANGRFADSYRLAQEAARWADTRGYARRANEIRARALVYLGSESWTEPRDSAPAADTRVNEHGQEEDDRSRDPGDR